MSTQLDPAGSRRGLRRDEAERRAGLLTVDHYAVDLDIRDGGDGRAESFRSRTTIDFHSRGGDTFIDVRPVTLRSAELDGTPIDPGLLEGGRLPIRAAEGAHHLTVDAVMPYRTDGEGMHRALDPADGEHYLYGMSFMDAAPTIFACFDQPDLKAPLVLSVQAPPEWHVEANAPGRRLAEGRWEFDETAPLSTYLITVVAGPWHVLRDEHDGIPLSLSARRSIAEHLDREAGELFTITKQCFDEFHRLFGIRYPFVKYHQAFVPEFNAGAMENPGCVTLRDPEIFTSRATRGQRVQRATFIAHEMAHQWFGDITTPRWWDDLWLNESFAEYMGVRAVADRTEFADAWTYNAYSRWQWGLVADQRPTTHPVAANGAVDAATALQDFDGISYAKGSAVLKQLNAQLGDEVFFRGITSHLERHRFGNATMDDLLAAWEEAGARDLRTFTASWLAEAGVDALTFDRGAGRIVRVAPAGSAASRGHRLSVLLAAPGNDGPADPWRAVPVDIAPSDDAVEVEAAAGDAVVVDPTARTWALTVPDELTFAALPGLLPRTGDGMVRAGIWQNVRNGVHNAAFDPAAVVALLAAAIPTEDVDAALETLLPWALAKVVPFGREPGRLLAQVHTAAAEKAERAGPGTSVQLAAFQGAVASASDEKRLRDWLLPGSRPEGLELDSDLRWRVITRLAALGFCDRDELDAELAADQTSQSSVHHAYAVAATPTRAGKQFAWDRFTRVVDVPNVELTAAGEGMWQAGPSDVLAEYAEKYFADLPAAAGHYTGWVLGEVAETFFPISQADPETVAAGRRLLGDTGLDATLRRRVVNRVDELERRLRLRARFA